MMVDKVCLHCGSQFRTKHTEVGKYCSMTCYRAYEAIHGKPVHTHPITFTCKTCSAEFQRFPGFLKQYRKKFGKDPMYCSIACSSIGRKADTESEWDHKCTTCGKDIPVTRTANGRYKRPKKFCSAACKGTSRSAGYHAKHPGRPMARRIVRNGYVYIRLPYEDGKIGREVFEHRYAMEQHIGRLLLPEETVHHVNGDRQHNTIDNLELFSSRHGPGQRVTDKIAFAIEMLRLYPEFARAQGVMLADVVH